jgi:ketosteroid isomerase-like protein/predicted transcriptional regulator
MEIKRVLTLISKSSAVPRHKDNKTIIQMVGLLICVILIDESHKFVIMKKIYLSALIVLLLTACQTKKDIQEDMKAIHIWTENYMEAIKTTDIERLLSLESDDICYLPPNQPILHGKEAARKWLLGYFNYFSPEETLYVLDIEIIDDYAFLRGKYTFFGKVKQSGEEFRDNGKFIDIFKRQPNGDWKCTHSIWNSDNRTFDSYSQIPADFSGTWKLDLSKSTTLPDIVSSTLVITQKGNDITINRTYEIKDKEPLISTFNYIIGDRIESKSRTGTTRITSSWGTDKHTFSIIETLLTEKNGAKQEYKRTTVHSLTEKGEVLNVISYDILPEGSLTPTNERHTELIYIKF